MKALAVEFPLTQLCQLFAVSRSGYYAWLQRKPSPREQADLELLPLIRRAYALGRQTYGSPRITRELKRQQQSCGRHRVARLMRLAGLRAVQKPAFRPRTTQSRHDLPLAPNRLKQQAAPARPDQVWVADITYVATCQGWLYLAVVMDLCSRRILGWSVANHLKSSLVKEALSRALTGRRPAPGLLHHSDRGIQYASSAYQALLQSWQIQPSMSAQGNCYDNAAMEAFFRTLKTELLHRHTWRTQSEVQLALFDYLETFYNRRRLHSALNYLSPVDFEAKLCYANN